MTGTPKNPEEFTVDKTSYSEEDGITPTSSRLVWCEYNRLLFGNKKIYKFKLKD